MYTKDGVDRFNEKEDIVFYSGKTPLITSKNVKNNIINTKTDSSTKYAINIANKLQIENSIIYSSTIEILKIIINILVDSYGKEKSTYFEFKKIINLLMVNDEKNLLRKISNISNNTKKQISKYYTMQEQTQTAVMTTILFGLRKVKENEKVLDN